VVSGHFECVMAFDLVDDVDHIVHVAKLYFVDWLTAV